MLKHELNALDIIYDFFEIDITKPFDCIPNDKYLQKQNPPLKKIKDGKKIAMKKKNYH